MKNKVQLITYADRLGDGTLSSMTDILRTRFDGVYDGVHMTNVATVDGLEPDRYFKQVGQLTDCARS